MTELNVSIVSIGLSDLLEKSRSFTSEADQLIQEKMLESVNENIVSVARSLAPKRTGALQDSIGAEAGDDPMSVILYASRSYAGYLESGTVPHRIEPRDAKALAFQINGKTVFAKSVQHPGIPSHPFLRPAIEVGKAKVAQDLAGVIIEQLE